MPIGRKKVRQKRDAPVCPPGDIDVVCDGPEDCGGASPYCCGKLSVGPGAPPACPVQKVSSACEAMCMTNLAPMCDMTARVRACQRQADCATDAGSKNCCEFKQGLIVVRMCVNDLFKAVADRCLP